MILIKTEPLLSIYIETSSDEKKLSRVYFNYLSEFKTAINWFSEIRHYSLFTSSLKMTVEANDYIRKYDLMSYIDNANDFIKNIVSNNIFTSYYAYIDVAKDMENPEWEAIKIVVYVNHLNNKDILKTWREISNSFHSSIPMEISKKIYIVLKKTETKRYIV